MEYIEPCDVTITVSGKIGSFQMEGTIEGSRESFKYESTNSHFMYYFPEMEIDSITINRAAMTPEQIEIIEACEKKIKDLLA